MPLMTPEQALRHTPARRARRPPLTRDRNGRILAGVAGGIARHLGVGPNAVRVAFVIGSFAAGFGVIVYLLVWMLAPEAVDDAVDQPLAPPRLAGRPTRALLISGVLVVAGVTLLFVSTGFWFGQEYGWPVALAAIGFAVLWARSTDTGRSRLDRSLASPMEAITSGRIPLTRMLLGGALIVAGMAVFLAANQSLSAAGNTVLAMLVAIGGVALLAGPWVRQMANQLLEERTSRVRADARAELAAHLHDSVLQTLALIQRATQSREMATLARTQERELRAWLYGRAPDARGARVRDAVDEMAGRIEATHRVPIEAVVVGDAPLTEDLRALVAATAEATTNAATHSGASAVAVYVEVEDDLATAFVRDHGSGFEPATVPADRRGIADSIVARMARHGGAATVSSVTGSGTEIALRLPRRPAP